MNRGEGVLAVGKGGWWGGGDLREFNGVVRWMDETNGRSGRVHSNSVIPPEHEVLMCGKQHCCEGLTIVVPFINWVVQLFGHR